MWIQSLNITILLTLSKNSKNMIWVGSELGISRFNPSIRYFDRPFKSTLEDGHAIISPEAIVEDEHGHLWIHSRKEMDHLYKINPEKNQLACMTCGTDILRMHKIHALFMDDDRHVWIGADHGLFYPDSETGRIQEYLTPDGKSLGEVTALENGDGGALWVGTQNGLISINGDEIILYEQKDGVNSLVDNRITDLDWDGNKKELLIATKNGISRFVNTDKKFINYQETPYADSIIENDVKEILVAEKSGNVWFTTLNNPGINCLYISPNLQYGGIDTLFTHLENDPVDPESLTDNIIECFIEDMAGHVWIGTNQNGISFHSFVEPKFHSIQYDQENEWGLKSDKIYSISMHPYGMMWTATGYGLEFISQDGIREYDYQKSILGHVNNILDVVVVNEDVIWVATDEGIIRINTMTDEMDHFSENESIALERQIPDNRIFDLMVSQNGDIWAGTATGLLVIDTTEMSVKIFNSDLIIRVLFEDMEGNIWAGTEREGLYFLNHQLISNIKNKDNFEIEGHIFDPTLSGGISSSQITCISEDLNGEIWIGTVGGLNKYVKETDNFIHYFIEDGLPSNYVTAVSFDDQNNLWISTKKGLSYFDRATSLFINYNLTDGIGNLDYHRNSFDSDSLGNIFFGGPNGITKVKSMGLQYNDYQPPCIITRIKKTNFEDEITEVFNIATNPKFQTNNVIEINHKVKSFTIDFVALNYYNTVKNQYRYKLEPLDKDWVEAGDLRFATYYNLGRGKYQFKVQGSNDDGLWSEPENLNIIFIPHPLLSYWAYGFYLLFAAIGIYVYMQQRMSKQKSELEEERRHQEMDQAREFQESLIPQMPPDHPDYEFAFHLKTSTEVGGDYYDFFPQEDGSLYVVVGDATGHGMTAGMMVSITKAGLVSTTIDSPAEVTKNLNRAIKSIDLGTTRMSLNMTKIENGTFEFTSAGMPPGYIYRHHDKSVEEILVPGLPLGSMKYAEFDHQIFDMKSGDAFVLLSDGLPECVNPVGDMLDYEAVEKCTKENGHLSAQGIVDALIDLGNDWMSGLMNDDDITLVVIKRK